MGPFIHIGWVQCRSSPLTRMKRSWRCLSRVSFNVTFTKSKYRRGCICWSSSSHASSKSLTRRSIWSVRDEWLVVAWTTEILSACVEGLWTWQESNATTSTWLSNKRYSWIRFTKSWRLCSTTWTMTSKWESKNTTCTWPPTLQSEVWSMLFWMDTGLWIECWFVPSWKCLDSRQM